MNYLFSGLLRVQSSLRVIPPSFTSKNTFFTSALSKCFQDLYVQTRFFHSKLTLIICFPFAYRYIRSENKYGAGGGDNKYGGSSGGSRFDGGVARRNDRFSGRVDKNNSQGGGRRSNFDDQQLKRIQWNQETLTPLKKDFYRPSMVGRSRQEVEHFLKKNEITVKGREVPETIFEFTECGFPSFITGEMTRQGFTSPTVIQAQGTFISFDLVLHHILIHFLLD